MKAHSTRTQTTSHRAQSQVPTILRGRWLTVARVVCTTVTLLAVTLFLVSLPALYNGFRTLSAYGRDARSVLRANLAQVGLSVDFYAAYNFALGVVLAVVCFALAVIIYYFRSNELMALFTAVMLI